MYVYIYIYTYIHAIRSRDLPNERSSPVNEKSRNVDVRYG